MCRIPVRPFDYMVKAGQSAYGPYLEAKEHVGGFSVLEAADMDEVLAWARKGVIACRAPIEVREIFSKPNPKRLSGSDNTAGEADLTDKIR